LPPESEDVSHEELGGWLTPREWAASTGDQMFNPIRHVLKTRILFPGPAIGLQRFCIPAE
jgi:hypothetical protein